MGKITIYSPKNNNNGEEVKMKTNIWNLATTIVGFIISIFTIVSYFNKQENRMTKLESNSSQTLSLLKDSIESNKSIAKNHTDLLIEVKGLKTDIAENRKDIQFNSKNIDRIEYSNGKKRR